MREPEYKYAIEIFWSEEDGCFVACVPDLGDELRGSPGTGPRGHLGRP